MKLSLPSLSNISFSWLWLTLLTLVLSLGLSWVLLIPLDFAYPWFYEWIDIHRHIETFAPKNAFKADFVVTTDDERFRLFGLIVEAIHQQGIGLTSLTYHDQKGLAIDTLLNHDEVVHLQDVATLIERLKILLMICIGLFVLILSWMAARSDALPSFGSIFLSVMLFIVVFVIGILLIGPYEVFYKLHMWIFPAEHKWFFYYEESLMSTMMKAPDLFAYIAILQILFTLPILVALMSFNRWIVGLGIRRRSQA